MIECEACNSVPWASYPEPGSITLRRQEAHHALLDKQAAEIARLKEIKP